MKNPWINIKHTDYENHMTEVGQAQVLNGLTKRCLSQYRPVNFALLGCATGNGLEHVDANFTSTVYAIDINQDYLTTTKERFGKQISKLELINSDIQHDDLTIQNVDLFFIGLVLEYVSPQKVLNKIIKAIRERGVLFIVIQKSKRTSFVSKTKYKSLEALAGISNEVNEDEIDHFIRLNNMELINKQRIELTENKAFISLEYRKCRD